MSPYSDRPSARRTLSSLSLSLWLCACSFGSDAPASAPPPPPPLPPAPPGVAEPPSLPEGVPADAMKALEALGKLGQDGQAAMGPVVSFRELLPFLKDDLAGFVADGAAEGKTSALQGMQVTEVKRRYRQGEQSLRVSITDTSLAPFMRAGFAMAQMVQEDSTRGYKKGGVFQGQPGIAEWNEHGKSELHVLAGGRFLIDISISKSSAGAAEQLLNALDVSGIVATAQKAQNNAAAPTAPAQGN